MMTPPDDTPRDTLNDGPLTNRQALLVLLALGRAAYACGEYSTADAFFSEMDQEMDYPPLSPDAPPTGN